MVLQGAAQESNLADGYDTHRPEDSEIQDALNRLLNSQALARSKRAQQLLQYLVEQEMAGAGERLKGFSIAQDVFGKGDEFDPQSDAVVRVQAGRLRENIAAYYYKEGRSDPVRISVPIGTYVPTYETIEEIHEPDGNSDTETDSTKHIDPSTGVGISGNLAAFWAVLVTIVALLSAILYSIWPNDEAIEIGQPKAEDSSIVAQTPAQIRSSLPRIEIALRSAPDGERAQEWLSRISNAASRFHTVELVNVPVGFSQSTAEDVDFRANLSVRENNTVDVDMVHLDSDVTVWSANVALTQDQRDDLNYSVPGALTALLLPSGRLYSFLAERGELSDLARCLWLTNAYYINQNSERFIEAFNCHDVIIKSETVSALVYADMASLLVERITDRYAYPSEVSEDDAFAMARKAIEVDSSAESYRALGISLSLFGDDAGREEAYRKAYSLNPFDLEIAASYGWSLLQSGAFEEAVFILEDVLKNASAERSWWSYSLFISAYVSGNLDAADFAARKLAGSKRPHYVAARIIVAHERQNFALRDQLLQTLRKSSSRIARDPGAYYKRLYGDEAAAILTEALADAGFSGNGQP